MGRKSLHPIFTYLALIGICIPQVGIPKDSIDELKEVVDTIREYRDKLKSEEHQSIHLTMDPQQADRSNQVCVSCPKIAPITQQVNKIVRELARKEHEHPAVMEEVDKLEGMYHLTITGSWGPGDSPQDCFRTEIGPTPIREHNDFPEEYAIRLFDTEIDIDKIRTIQYFPSDKTRIYFFRGSGNDRNKVIRVIARAKGPAQITYFKIDQNHIDLQLPDMSRRYKDDESNEEIESAFNLGNTSSDSDEDDESESMGFMFTSEVASGDREKDEQGEPRKLTEQERQRLNRVLSAEYGLSIEQEDGLPKKLRLLDFYAGYKVNESVRFQGQARIDSEDQKVELSVVDGENNPYLELEIEENKATYRIPVQMQFQQSDWYVKGGIQGKVEGSDHRGELKLDLMSSSRSDQVYTARITNNDGRTKASLRHERNVGVGRMSIELGDNGEHWISWEGRF